MRRSRKGNVAGEETSMIKKWWKMTWRECMRGGIMYVPCWVNKLWKYVDMVGLCITYTMAHAHEDSALYFCEHTRLNYSHFLSHFPCLSSSISFVCLQPFLHSSHPQSPIPSSSLCFRLRKWFVCRLRLAGTLCGALGKPKFEPWCIKCSTRATVSVMGNHVVGHC